MKKILFNDKFGLTQAVLEGRNRQTRRIIKSSDAFERVNPDFDWNREDIKNWENSFTLTVQNMSEEEKKNCFDYLLAHPKYKVGEVVAVAQSYNDCGYKCFHYRDTDEFMYFVKDNKEISIRPAGVTNKMFVAPSLMPHQIHITNVRVERLQDISDECCLKEGIIKKWHAPACKNYYYVPGVEVKSVKDVHDTPQEAFAHLINKVSRKDVWKENPYVFVYDFELVK